MDWEGVAAAMGWYRYRGRGGGGGRLAVSSVYIWYTPLSFLGSCGPQRGAKGRKGAQQVYDLCGRGSGADRSGGGGRGGRPPVREAAGGRALAAEAEARLRARKCLPDCIILARVRARTQCIVCIVVCIVEL